MKIINVFINKYGQKSKIIQRWFPAVVDTFLREQIYFNYPGGGISLRVPDVSGRPREPEPDNAGGGKGW
jgi:hypothetical protein